MDARVELRNLIEQYFPNQTDQLLVREILKKYRALFLSEKKPKDVVLSEKRVREIVFETVMELKLEEEEEPSDIVVEEIRSLDEELEKADNEWVDSLNDFMVRRN